MLKKVKKGDVVLYVEESGNVSFAVLVTSNTLLYSSTGFGNYNDFRGVIIAADNNHGDMEIGRTDNDWWMGDDHWVRIKRKNVMELLSRPINDSILMTFGDGL